MACHPMGTRQLTVGIPAPEAQELNSASRLEYFRYLKCPSLEEGSHLWELVFSRGMFPLPNPGIVGAAVVDSMAGSESIHRPENYAAN